MKVERICYWILIFALGILLLKMQYCSKRKPCPTTTVQVVHDTVDKEDSFVTAKPKPIAVKKKRNAVIRSDESLPTPEVNDNLTVAGVDCNCGDTLVYSNQYTTAEGSVIVNNEVANNELFNQEVKISAKTIKTTEYIKQTDTVYKEKQKVILFFGAGLYGNKTQAGAILKTSLKLKNDYTPFAGRMQGFGNQSFWFGGIDVPIKLKKK